MSFKIMILGGGSFAHANMQTLKDAGAKVFAWLDPTSGDYGPSLAGKVFSTQQYPSPIPLIKQLKIDFVIPRSIDWHEQPWTKDFLAHNIPILSPTGEAMRLERDRDFNKQLCIKYNIPVAKAFFAHNKQEAKKIIKKENIPFVIKNPLCSPSAPIHAIVNETVEATLSWLDHLDYSEGVYLQEYLGTREAGHLAFVSDGEVYPLVTNQEYKKAFNSNMGPTAGAPLGGLVEQDPDDKYGIVRQTIAPLLPWFKQVNFHGPVQATCIKKKNKWHVIEYNVRTGVTTGPAMIRMLTNPLDIFHRVSTNQPIHIKFKKNKRFACILSLAGYGYPYSELTSPLSPVTLHSKPTCDLWWNQITTIKNKLFLDGHRVADIIATGQNLEQTISKAYQNINKIYCPNSYYRTDIGESLWPPGNK